METLTITESVLKYLRLTATECVEELTAPEHEALIDSRDRLWDTMTAAEREAANVLAQAVFGPWI